MKQRILAVDDEPDILKLLERIIAAKTPYAIRTTNNSLEVPQILEETSFDLIITDLKMPGMDGLDILRFIKENQRTEEVIIITAFGSLETAMEAMSKGVFDYITKPFRKEQLIFTVDRAMRWQSVKQDATKMLKVFGQEPFATAQRTFQRDYVRRLVSRCDGDLNRTAERAGLPMEVIEATLRDEEADGG